MPTRPRGISSVDAASGPYAAELRAFRPKTGIPATGRCTRRAPRWWPAACRIEVSICVRKEPCNVVRQPRSWGKEGRRKHCLMMEERNIAARQQCPASSLQICAHKIDQILSQVRCDLFLRFRSEMKTNVILKYLTHQTVDATVNRGQ